jgi:hypothetical protein
MCIKERAMANLKDCPKFEVYDDYYTPKYAWEWIEHLLPKDKICWEACLLNSHMSNSKKYLQELGLNVIGETSYDYFEMKDTLEYDYIVTNIPFETKLKKKLLTEMVKQDKPFITIMNCMNVFSNYFSDIFKDHRKHLQILHPKGKIHFNKLLANGKTEYKKNTSFYCVYVAFKMNIPVEDQVLLETKTN